MMGMDRFPSLEVGLNASHVVASHHVLFEGNYCQNADRGDADGNPIYHTFFRNHIRGNRPAFDNAMALLTQTLRWFDAPLLDVLRWQLAQGHWSDAWMGMRNCLCQWHAKHLDAWVGRGETLFN
jgi:hypothetical protein